MDQLDNNQPDLNSDPTARQFKRPWHKRPVFYVFLVLVFVLGYYAYQFSQAYNTISVENGSWWSGVANFLSLNKTAEETPDPNPMPLPEPDRLDVLILGFRGDNEAAIAEEGGLLTDTMMVLSVDKITKKASIISIPRDLYIEMSADAANRKKIGLKGKINEVYERGIENGGGLTLAKQIVSRITGVYIDNAVAFDFNAFKEIVTTLGGIDVYLEKPFDEKSQWGYDFSLPAGENHLAGDQALYYVRSRYSTNDFDRARRQQEVINSIKSKALTLGFLSNPVKVTTLLSGIKSNIRTDFQIWDIKNLVALANSFGDKTTAKSYIISTDNLLSESKTEKGEYILLPKEGNYDGIKSLFKNILAN